MRLVARGATLQLHGSVRECEWPTEIAVALEASRLIRIYRLEGASQNAAVRVMAIHAGHGSFRKAVMIDPLKTGPNGGMALCAERVDFLVGPRDQTGGAMDRVACEATHLVSDMAALDAPDLGGLIQMTLETNLVRRGRLEPGGISNVGGAGGFGVAAGRAVAGFAGVSDGVVLRIGLRQIMRIVFEGVEEILVTGLANFRADILRRFLRGGRSLGEHGHEEQ